MAQAKSEDNRVANDSNDNCQSKLLNNNSLIFNHHLAYNSQTTLQFATLNVRSLNSPNKIADFDLLLHENNIDIATI